MEFSEIAAKYNLSLNNKGFDTQEIGRVITVADGIAQVFGLFNVFMNEVVNFSSGAVGIVMSLDIDFVCVAIIGDYSGVREHDIVTRTKGLPMAPYGMGVLGRVLNGVGEPIDDLGDLDNVEERPIERDAPTMMDRKSVFEPMYTGMLSIDSCLAIGLGQRELVIGDRQSGKTTLALNMMINQISDLSKKVFCVYVSIGQKRSEVAMILDKLKKAGVMDYSVIVAATASDSAIEQFIAPYLACTIAEYFRDNGMHALIIYDDLSKHAVAYREISLLLKRPPGREAYPGDVFYIHSRLLERAGKMSDQKGGGSMTAIPIIETQGGDVSKYIPTNVISITDGQIFLDMNMFRSGITPPINLTLSVSRIGSNAQEKMVKKLSGGLKSLIAQYEELKEFTKFSTSKDDDTQRVLDNGAILSKIFQQSDPMNFVRSIITLFSFKEGYLNKLAIKMKKKHEGLLEKNTFTIAQINYFEFVGYVMRMNEDLCAKINQREFGENEQKILSRLLDMGIDDFVRQLD